jgi:hypothetical protein
MRYILLLLLFTANIAHGQSYINFALSPRNTDTAKTLLNLLVNGYVRLPSYASADSNKVLGVTSSGMLVLRTKGAGGGGGSGTVTSAGYTAGRGITISGTNPITGVGTWRFDADTTIIQKSISLTTTGTSGAATFNGVTLNIPQYAGATYTAGNWLTLNSGVFNFDSTNRVDYTFSAPTSLKLVASSVLNAQLGNVYLAIGDTTEMLRDSLTDHWTEIMGKVNYSDTTTIIATKANVNTKQNFSDTSTYDATRSWVGLQIPSLTGYVPYTGATANVDLGGNSLTAEYIISDTVQSNTGTLHLHGTLGTGILIGVDGSLVFDRYPTAVAGDSVLTTNSIGAVQQYNLKTKLANYVTYTNPTADVNLGAYNLITSLVKTDTVQANSSMGVHIHGTGGKGIMVGAGGGGTITFDDYTTTVAGDSVLTTNSAGGLLRYNLKGKLANYYLASNPNGYTSDTGTVTSVGVVAGTGVSIGGTSPITSAGTYTITNTAPDQTVTITASTNITVTGSYPTFTISATGGGGGVAKLKAVAPVTLTAGTGDTVIISISPNTTYQITEATQFGYSGANGLIQKITMNNAQDTVTVDTTTLVEGVTYELRVIQGAGGNKILHWANTGTLFQGGTTATGRPYQDIGAAEISRYFIQKSDALLFVNPVINNRE